MTPARSAPDVGKPDSHRGNFIKISDGNIKADTTLGSYYVAAGNIIEIVQIPYNIGWNVSEV